VPTQRSAQPATEWPINAVARLTGTTARALRHFGDIGILAPSRIGENGYRYYDRDGLIRLQRILLLRQLEVPMPAIIEIVSREPDAAAALERQIGRLRAERERIDRQLDAVTRTLAAVHEGTAIEPADMFDGFNHTAFASELEPRWSLGAE